MSTDRTSYAELRLERCRRWTRGISQCDERGCYCSRAWLGATAAFVGHARQDSQRSTLIRHHSVRVGSKIESPRGAILTCTDLPRASNRHPYFIQVFQSANRTACVRYFSCGIGDVDSVYNEQLARNAREKLDLTFSDEKAFCDLDAPVAVPQP